ncbi:MAG TPA: (2Fe-2S)-binding protein [Alphaproteobacteria bacterium]
MTETCAIALTINGREHRLSVAPSLTLADLLRDQLGLTGTKVSCDQSVCGACTVLIDGRPVAACTEFAFQADGRSITTIEGLAKTPAELHPIQAAFIEASAFQCGFCTSGMILLLKSLLDRNPDPDEATLREWVSCNICRCTGYEVILDAARLAAKAQRTAAAS